MLYRQYRSFDSNFVTPPVPPRLVSPETRLHVPANGNFPKPLNSAGLGLQPLVGNQQFHFADGIDARRKIARIQITGILAILSARFKF